MRTELVQVRLFCVQSEILVGKENFQLKVVSFVCSPLDLLAPSGFH